MDVYSDDIHKMETKFMREIFEQTILVADVPKIEDDGRQVSIP